MREILFRAKTVDENEWIYGDIFHSGACPEIMRIHDYKNRVNYAVNPETLGQYTGLTDKNGVKIFEGDILSSDKYPYTSDGSQNYFAEVVWFDNCPAFGLYVFKAPKSEVRGVAEGSEFIEDDLSDMEVIGNVYDNPELVGGDGNAAD